MIQTHDKLSEEYNKLLNEYGGTFPTSAQLDEIQRIYGELQGVLATKEVEAEESDAPDGYKTIKQAAVDDPEYINRLRQTIGSREVFQELIRKVETKNLEISRETENWAVKTNQYFSLKAAVERYQNAVEEQKAYNPDVADPIISRLESIQQKQQITDVRTENLASERLTSDQERLLQENEGELPNVHEGTDIISKLRNTVRQQAEIQGLSARLEGEKNRAESINASIRQLDAVQKLEGEAPEEPRKSNGPILIGLGVANRSYNVEEMMLYDVRMSSTFLHC